MTGANTVEQQTGSDEKVLKVSRTTDPQAFGTALAREVIRARKESTEVISMAIGEKAVNQMVKGTIIARGILTQEGVNILISPFFRDIPLADLEEKTHYTGVGFKFVLL